MENVLFPEIDQFINTLNPETISEERKATLQPLIVFIQEKVSANSAIRINFICTHNSRRSHLSQVWAQTMAAHFGIKNVFCYSGGTEATALFPMVAKTLANTGFQIAKLSQENNPVYSIKFVKFGKHSSIALLFYIVISFIYNTTLKTHPILTKKHTHAI